MIDFTQLWNKEKAIRDFNTGQSKADLVALTNEIIDTMLASIADATEAEVAFIYDDPNANDGGDTTPWTLPHVVVHTTASAEEAAFHALALARGLVPEGRSRYETQWQSVTSIAQCRARLDESRRMRLAMLDAWPDAPHLDIRQESSYFGSMNAVDRFLVGVQHDAIHIGQINQIMTQARAKRGV